MDFSPTRSVVVAVAIVVAAAAVAAVAAAATAAAAAATDMLIPNEVVRRYYAKGMKQIVVDEGMLQVACVKEDMVYERVEGWTRRPCDRCRSSWVNTSTGTIVPCKKCGKTFHQMCHKPKINNPDIDDFVCPKCTGQDKDLCVVCDEDHAIRAEASDSDSAEDNDMFYCDGCNKCWHQYCHEPYIYPKPKEDEPWFCNACNKGQVSMRQCAPHNRGAKGSGKGRGGKGRLPSRPNPERRAPRLPREKSAQGANLHEDALLPTVAKAGFKENTTRKHRTVWRSVDPAACARETRRNRATVADNWSSGDDIPLMKKHTRKDGGDRDKDEYWSSGDDVPLMKKHTGKDGGDTDKHNDNDENWSSEDDVPLMKKHTGKDGGDRDKDGYWSSGDDVPLMKKHTGKDAGDTDKHNP